MTQYIGFMIPDPGGTPHYYTFQVMAYGCNPAVTIVTRLLRPIKAFLYRFDIKFTIYIDDGRFSVSSPDLCSEYMHFTCRFSSLQVGSERKPSSFLHNASSTWASILTQPP
jgi:hypothetical protein